MHRDSSLLDSSLTINAPKAGSTAARPSWYSLTFSDDEESESDLSPATCSAALRTEDTWSEASTDVGLDDVDDVDEAGDFEAEAEVEYVREHEVTAPVTRPSFPKVSRQQRVDQLRRLVDEFLTLDFNSVDASSQHGLVCRMLAILKSLSETAIFYDEGGRSEEKRLSLLGLGQDDEDAIHEATVHAEELCDGRLFHSAFDVLKEVRSRLREQTVPDSKQLSAEELEAMKARRLQRRQRQREERREQRKTDRAERSAWRRQPPAKAATLHPPKESGVSWNRWRH